MTEFRITKQNQKTLRSHTIDDTHPGTLLHDFNAMLDFIGPDGVSVGDGGHLSNAVIVPLDALLSRPLRLPFVKRTTMKSHPYLCGLHLVLLSSGLGKIQGSASKPKFVPDPQRMELWRSLNPVEQYFNLLEAWMFISKNEMVDSQRRSNFDLLQQSRNLWMLRGSSDPKVVRRREAWLMMSLRHTMYQMALLDLFGLLDVKHPKKPVIPWAPKEEPTLTPFGNALMSLLASWEEADADEEAEDRESFGVLQPLIQPYFPQWQKTLLLPETTLERRGIFVFEVSLGTDVSRTIAIHDEDTLDDLLGAILGSVGFDNEHLYEYTFHDLLGRTVKVTDPRVEEDESGDEFPVAFLPLSLGESMELIYDFGRSWHFDVKLLRIDPYGSVKGKLPRTLEKQGKAPPQYRNWD